MTEQLQDKVQEPLLKTDDGALEDEELSEPAEETRRIDYEQTYRKKHKWVQTHRTDERQKQKPANKRRLFRGIWQ
ncbi:hypothetical protein EGH25_01845 [Haladaptatus sp. F3-133]|jgi:hypothetical protein|uniref:Uncharacterized protein n=1 Tax=Halorutilus salinus TaxID=2487751 RepID=A0A9Q4C195_9EURY|nr:hypothetical protein [Halorutilus salinus]MCX2818097.1 hypothetical protein [Halorutilus salinus]